MCCMTPSVGLRMCLIAVPADSEALSKAHETAQLMLFKPHLSLSLSLCTGGVRAQAQPQTRS